MYTVYLTAFDLSPENAHRIEKTERSPDVEINTSLTSLSELSMMAEYGVDINPKYPP